jgi:uncharacterized protein (DUF488 family)
VEDRAEALPIYTIGYGNRSLDDFLGLLQRYDIRYLVDIRSQPYSRYHPEFSQNALQTALTKHQTRYIFLGDRLGGRPTDEACYVNGKVDYTLVKEQPFFQQGIQRLKQAWLKNARMVLMCSELKPHECHRSKLLAPSLLADGITVAHIDEQGQLKTQNQVIEVLTGGQLSLFADETFNPKIGLSRKKYNTDKVQEENEEEWPPE